MKPKLISEAKQIIPKWEKKIRSENYNAEEYKNMVLSLSDFRFCVVGEAHGFTDEYKTKCEACRNFTHNIGFSFEHAKIKLIKGHNYYVIDPKTIKPYMVERLISRTNRFLEHFIKSHLRK